MEKEDRSRGRTALTLRGTRNDVTHSRASKEVTFQQSSDLAGCSALAPHKRDSEAECKVVPVFVTIAHVQILDGMYFVLITIYKVKNQNQIITRSDVTALQRRHFRDPEAERKVVSTFVIIAHFQMRTDARAKAA